MVRAAAAYARISSDQDGRGLGVQRQVEDCRALASDRSWAVAEEYVDNDVSTYSGKTRPGYRRMLAKRAAGEQDAVTVYNLHRLYRQPAELEDFVTLCEKAGVTNVATVTADIDLGNDDGLFMARTTCLTRARADHSLAIRKMNSAFSSETSRNHSWVHFISAITLRL